jgi:hypothetical protein
MARPGLYVTRMILEAGIELLQKCYQFLTVESRHGGTAWSFNRLFIGI